MSPNTRAEQKERSHQAILDSATRLLRERGIAGARVLDVMQGAQLTAGAFYAHFSSKDELVDRALERACENLRHTLFADLANVPAEDQVETVLGRYLSAAHRDRPHKGCPFPAIAAEVGTSERQHRATFSAQVQALIDGIAQHLPRQARGLALGLAALMYGGLSLSRALRGTALSDDVLAACRELGASAVRRSLR